MKIGIENFRVFKNYTEFDFKPITIITGPNNSGKSSLIKFLLLVKDNIKKSLFDYEYNPNYETDEKGHYMMGYTVEKRKIDFRSYEHNLSSLSLVLNDKNKPIIFRFKKDDGKNFYREFKIDNATGKNITDIKLITINNEIIIDATKDNTYVDLKLFIEYILNEEDFSRLSINEQQNRYFTTNLTKEYKDNLIESINKWRTKNTDKIDISSSKILEIFGDHLYPDHNMNDNMVGINALVFIVDVLINGNTERKIKNTLDYRDNVIVYRELLQMDNYMQFCNRLNYLPIAKGQKRFYTERDTDVIKLLIQKTDLQPLNTRNKVFMNKWINEFSIGEKLEYEYNEKKGVYFIEIDGLSLLEYGYGFTQLIAIILNITTTKSNDILILEEPEANLHPNFQSKLAELFVDAYKELGIHFIIETHSEYLIRKMQLLTAETNKKKTNLKSNDSIIYYFNHPKKILKKGEKQVKEIRILDNGSLSDNFGSGFTDETESLLLDLMKLNRAQQN